jgi:hypothetical protein
MDINTAAQSALQLVEKFRALEQVGLALQALGSLEGHKAELTLDIARLQSAQTAAQLALATAETEASGKIAALKKETAEAETELKAALDKHDIFLADAETQRVKKLQEQKCLDAALAETKERMKQLASAAGG